jgi:para-aminobenzoate synthetase component 1
MLNWASQFNIFCFLNSNNFNHLHQEFDGLFAIDAEQVLELQNDDFSQPLKQFAADNPGWIFGHLNYPQKKQDSIAFPPGCFFVPKILLQISKDSISISSQQDPEAIFNQICATSEVLDANLVIKEEIKSATSKEEYLQAIEAIKAHLKRGDCYEINYCQEFYSNHIKLNPLALYVNLMNSSPAPFSVLYKWHEKYCISASPERFLKKKGDLLVSQPIKGTAKRDFQNKANDEAGKIYLQQSQKEKSENIMIVDLVRNDLSKVCSRGSVKVEELMGIYSFPQVHQMISTVVGTLNKAIHWTEALQACYPMGSMTGAPKKRVMELIDVYEKTPRGLFSGTIGYITPERDFDFNVVIRSYFYNDASHTISFKAGGGITINSDPLEEYEESLLKVEALKKILNSNHT